ncbi:MAG: MFS transporter, partial [Candidatus Tectomicrobia bacterium]|nr:MFS transporter [Candidatus Tectomicrobia bacterium]
DWGGIALLAVGLIGLQVLLERGQEENWFESNLITGWAVATVVAVAILVFWELRAPEPIVDIRIMRNVPLSVCSVISLVFGVALFGSTFVLPQFLQHLMHYTAYDAGLVLLPRGIALFLVLPIVGRLYNFVDPRFLLSLGTASILYSFYLLSHLSLDADFWSLVVPLIFMGVGMPLIFVTLATVALGSVRPAEATAASAIFNLFRRVGGNIGFALMATLVDRRSAVHRVGLVGYLNEFNAPFLDYHERVANILVSQRVDPATAQAKAYGIMDNLVNRQATMGAYNDSAWFMMVLFACVFPLIWMLPSRLKSAS